MTFPNTKKILIVCLIFTLKADGALARTVVGEYWNSSIAGIECSDVDCAISTFCEWAEPTDTIYIQYRNYKCPSNNAVKEIDRIEHYPNLSVETEPFNFYKAIVEFEYERTYGGSWVSTTDPSPALAPQLG